MTNEYGHADGVAPNDYGRSNAGDWSAKAFSGDYVNATVDEEDKGKVTLSDLVLVDADTQTGFQGPTNGSTPGENPLA